jgi:hypothetical protein
MWMPDEAERGDGAKRIPFTILPMRMSRVDPIATA